MLGFKDPRRIAFDNQVDQHWNRQGKLVHDPKARAAQKDQLWQQLGPKFSNLDECRTALYTEEMLKCMDRGPLTEDQYRERNVSTTTTVSKGFGAGAKMAAAAAEIKSHNAAKDPAMHALLNFPGAPGIGSSPRIVADQLEQHQKRQADASHAAVSAGGRNTLVPVKTIHGKP